MTFLRQVGASLAALVTLLSTNFASAGAIELKLAYFVGDQHAMSQWLVKWANNLEKDSGGRIAGKRFPGSQMGPVQQHYDFVRTGQADVAWFLHGATPGRFPLTEIVQVPYLVGSAEIGTKVLNDPELRSKYLDAEHRGVKVLLLLTHQPGNVHTTKRPIRTIEDMKGLRLRFASPTIRDFVAALGGTPVGVLPTEQVEQLQKGTQIAPNSAQAPIVAFANAPRIPGTYSSRAPQSPASSDLRSSCQSTVGTPSLSTPAPKPPRNRTV